MPGFVDGERERLAWAMRLGGLCGAMRGGPSEALPFLDGMMSMLGAEGGFLGVSGADGQARVVDRGMDSARLAAACDGRLEPLALTQAGAAQPVRVLGAAVGAITLGGPCYDGPILRVALFEDGARASLVLWFSEDGAGRARSRARLLNVVLDPLLAALRRLAEGAWQDPDGAPQVDAFGAWSRCSVPLLFLREDAVVVAANPAAWRKLDLAGVGLELPVWLHDEVRSRLEGLQVDGGLPEGASGDYAWVSAEDGDTLRRVGLVPVDGSAGAGQAAWLLSVESGGPSTSERVGAATKSFGLTPREADVLGALAEGLSNRLIAEAVGISEATVKFHLVSVMRKASSSNRTELLSVLYSLPV